MGDTRIVYTPRGTAGTETIVLGTNPVLQRFSGFINTDRVDLITLGGRRVSVTHDAFHRYRLTRRGIPASADPAVLWTTWRGYKSFEAHALGGGEFEFQMDSTLVSDTTMSSAAARGTLTVPLGTIAGMSVGDLLYIESADDPTIWEIKEINAFVPIGQVQFTDATKFDFPSGSIVRHHEYLPKCLVEGSAPFLLERDAGEGPNLWDWDMVFRTVR